MKRESLGQLSLQKLSLFHYYQNKYAYYSSSDADDTESMSCFRKRHPASVHVHTVDTGNYGRYTHYKSDCCKKLHYAVELVVYDV